MITYLVLCLAGLIKKKSKVLTFFMLLYMWIVFGFNTYSGDFLNYEYVYNSILNGQLYFEFEPGITILMIISKTAGLSYINFRMLIGLAYVALTYYTASKYTEYTAYAIALYMIFPFLVYVSVFRAGIAGILVTLAFKYMIDDNAYTTRKFVFFILLATLFHYSSALYLGVIIFKKYKPNLTLIGLVTSICILFTILYYSNILYKIANIFIDNYRILKYFDIQRNAVDINFKWAIYRFVIVFINIFILYLAKKTWLHFGGGKTDEKHVAKALNLAENLNLYMIITLPLLLLSNVFIRWIYGITFINICVLTLMMEKIDRKRKYYLPRYFSSMIKPQIFFVFWNIFMLLYASLPYIGTENDTLRLFSDNLLYLF